MNDKNTFKDNQLSDDQLGEVSGGLDLLPAKVDVVCKRCGKTFQTRYDKKMCDECVEETKIHKTENGAYGGW